MKELWLVLAIMSYMHVAMHHGRRSNNNFSKNYNDFLKTIIITLMLSVLLIKQI